MEAVLTEKAADVALAMALTFVEGREKAWRDGDAKYESWSLRGVLNEMDVDRRDADRVVRRAAARGFTHCVDPLIAVRDENGREEAPAMWACEWGVDQLRSRLQCLR